MSSSGALAPKAPYPPVITHNPPPHNSDFSDVFAIYLAKMTRDFVPIFNGFGLKNRIFHAFSAAKYISKMAKSTYLVGYVNIRLCIH